MTDTSLRPVARTFLLEGDALQLRYCATCGQYSAAWLRICPACRTGDLPLRPSSGSGVVLSWVTYRREYPLPFTLPVPYTVVLIELDEGVRVNGLLDDAIDAGSLARGQRVRLAAATADRPVFTR